VVLFCFFFDPKDQAVPFAAHASLVAAIKTKENKSISLTIKITLYEYNNFYSNIKLLISY
jgi:hypothetical protein